MILAIPTAILLALAGGGVLGQLGAARDATATTRSVGLVLAVQELIHSLQRERGLTNGMLGGEAGYRPDVDAQRVRSDATRAALDRLLTDEAVPGVARVRTALDRLSGLAAVRGAVDAGQGAAADVFTFYTAAIDALGEAPHDLATGQSRPALTRGLSALRELGRAKEAMARERGLLNGVFAAGSFTTEQYIEFAELRATRTDALAQFARVATPAQVTGLNAAQRSPAATRAAAYELRAIAGAGASRLGVDATAWWDAMTEQVDALRDVQRRVGDDVGAAAENERDEAVRTLWALVALAVASVLGAVLLGLATSRSIIRPLRLLAREADDVAVRRLPETVSRMQTTDDPDAAMVAGTADAGAGTGADVASASAARSDEIADVAAALVNVHRTAVRLAAEQAVLRRNTAESLANLGRRNQNLVRRQLGFISALEKEETDPGALADLFELDHLATRMRRNAESLLVLVGERGPRRSAGPVPVGDVLRSALSEVEDYRRVVLRKVDEALVRGPVVAEVAHLLAELIENALVFSPPDQDVEIHARIGADAYHIAIVDTGVGMAAEELETANARLRGERSFLVAPTRYLGHYVVGRLARRLGIRVWLHDSPLSGVTARVVLPADLLAERPASRPSAPAAIGAGRPAAPERADPEHAPRTRGRVGGPYEGGDGETGGGPRSVPAAGPVDPVREPAVMQARQFEPFRPATTPSGLVRRVPRTRRLAEPPLYAAATDGSDDGGTPGPPGGADRSPERVRSMLNDFRSGTRRSGRGHEGQEN